MYEFVVKTVTGPYPALLSVVILHNESGFSKSRAPLVNTSVYGHTLYLFTYVFMLNTLHVLLTLHSGRVAKLAHMGSREWI